MLPIHGDESPSNAIQRRNSKSNLGPSELFSALSASVWSESKKRAEMAYENYAKIDSFRPYFDVEPKEVLRRIIKSVDPRPPFSLDSGYDLYGPFMACLTLIAVLLFEMKLSVHKVQEGTLMGSAFLTCFGYWLVSSSLLNVICYFGKSSVSFTHILSFVGYALCSTCVILFVCAATHNGTTERLFFMLWILICGIAGTKLVSGRSVPLLSLCICLALNPKSNLTAGLNNVGNHSKRWLPHFWQRGRVRIAYAIRALPTLRLSRNSARYDIAYFTASPNPTIRYIKGHRC
ncbi:unnamed protein product [Hydatigera taeniaeformis]|uniref:Protein YIPF n=1 Tax=Hydatigena taeniaeformis TaxID=6205 RepID=A0A0R3X4X4_HYDTA|nr:unnamed protein product [Hydatigera taeniaeformis]